MTQSPDAAFTEMATAFIDQANAYAKTNDPAVIAIAMAHAAARYNVFANLAPQETPSQMVVQRDKRVNDRLAHYREFVELHYDEYTRIADPLRGK